MKERNAAPEERLIDEDGRSGPGHKGLELGPRHNQRLHVGPVGRDAPAQRSVGALQHVA